MQPESSDGFASVGTILPKGGAAQLPGGSFRLCGLCGKGEAPKGAKALPAPLYRPWRLGNGGFLWAANPQRRFLVQEAAREAFLRRV
jgi:hypothetical protein